MTPTSAPGEDAEIKKILAMDLDALNGIDSHDPFKELEAPQSADSASQVHILDRIIAGAKYRELEEKWRAAREEDVPAGRPYSQSLMQLLASERTSAYKNHALLQYRTAITQTKELYAQILGGDLLTAGPVRTLTMALADMFSKDRNLLLNFALGLIDSGDDFRYQHSLNVCILSMAAASASGFARAQVLDIAQGGLLADVGMFLVPDAVVKKSGRLTEEELREIHKHPQLGFGLLEKTQGLSDSVFAAMLQHHERLGGAGYPGRLQGAQITHAARIVGIADTLAAMTHKRNHREAQTPAEALQSVIKMGKVGFLDSAHIRTLIAYLGMYPLGSLVKLTSGKIAKVVEPHPEDLQRPTVSILYNEKGQALPTQNPLQFDLRRSETEKVAAALGHLDAKHDVLDGF